MKRIIRVFPKKTSHTPNDDLVFIGDPPFPEFLPEADEAHVSVTFTWNRAEGERLAAAWGQYIPTRLGGPAFGSHAGEFVPGRYLKKGYTITTRGCNRRCDFCFVPQREGKIRTLPIEPGYIVQDNNLLAAPLDHIIKVFEMLRNQDREVTFAGGLDARHFYIIDDFMIDQIARTRIREIFFAYDRPAQLPYLERVAGELYFLNRRKKRCYVLAGFEGDTIKAAEKRLIEVWNLGYLPFAMYMQGEQYREPPKDWARLIRTWRRPVMIHSMMGQAA